MLKILTVLPAMTEPGDDLVRLDFDQRNRRRKVFTTEAGAEILLDMPRPLHLRDGDGLKLEDGSCVRVEAIPEALIEIGASDASALLRIAWHLGNRHLPTQLVPGPDGGSLRIRHDHVIAEMAAGLGGNCQPVLAPFDPEGGAYASAGDLVRHDHHHHGEGHAHV